MSTAIARPNAAGSFTGIASQNPSSGAHYDKVDEEDTHDGYTTSVYTNQEARQRDTYKINNPLVGRVSISSIKIYFTHGSNTAIHDSYGRPVIYIIGGFAYTGTEYAITTTTFVEHSYEWTVNPATGLAWTAADIDNLEIGADLRVYFGGSSYNSYLTKIYAEITYEQLPPVAGGAQLIGPIW